MNARDPRELSAPGHTRAADGGLQIGGVAAQALARHYDTPLLVFDAGQFDDTLARYRAACATHGVHLAYAAKALFVTALAARLAPHSDVELDVCSLGEIVTAERGGFPAGRMYLHGCGKTGDELDAALEGRVARIIVDGPDELERLIARCGGRRIEIGLRVNTGVEAHTHAFVRTGGENTKFGFAPEHLEAALERVGATPGLVCSTLHSHVGSQIFETDAFLANLDALLDAALVAMRAGHPIERLLVGGGFGVDHDPAVPAPDATADLIAALAGRATAGAAERGLPVPVLGIEPGRALVATAGTSLYRVLALKAHGSRRFVIVDGSIADNPRPALYGAYHQPLVAQSQARGPLERATICGRACENDVLVDTALPTDLAVGDLIALCTTGAYTYSMASNYNRFCRPPIVEVGRGTHRLIVRRETLDDVLRTDMPAI